MVIDSDLLYIKGYGFFLSSDSCLRHHAHCRHWNKKFIVPLYQILKRKSFRGFNCLDYLMNTRIKERISIIILQNMVCSQYLSKVTLQYSRDVELELGVFVDSNYLQMSIWISSYILKLLHTLLSSILSIYNMLTLHVCTVLYSYSSFMLMLL